MNARKRPAQSAGLFRATLPRMNKENIEQEFADIKKIIRETSVIAREYFDADSTENEMKADGSVVTEVDKKIETALLSYIQERFPNDAIVGEEHGIHEGNSGFVWHIDPIDGTDNFLRKIPFCCVSVARLGDGPEDSFGIINNPITGQMFASLMEAGTYENEHIVNLTKDSLGGRCIIAIGAKSNDWRKKAKNNLYAGLSDRFGKGTSYSSCALELAYVAANRIDAHLTFDLNTYDYAAGLYLVKAAGGAISVFENGVWQRWEGSTKDLCSEHGKTIFSSHPEVHDEIRDFIGDPKAWAEK